MKKYASEEFGFTLLEIIIVLALIGSIAAVVMPNLTLSVDSQMSSSLRNLTGQMRAAYDDAIFSGRMHRMVFDLSAGEYWVEQAPLGFEGRPPQLQTGTELDAKLKQDKRNELLKYLDEIANIEGNREIPFQNKSDNSYYSLRSIPVVQRKVLKPVTWKEIDDSVIYRQKLPGKIVFAEMQLGVSKKVYKYTEFYNKNSKEKKEYAYTYFLANGTATPTSIKLAARHPQRQDAIDDDGAKYTINLNTLTGESNLLEGFHDANFSLSK
ncbi:type II secretion system protein [Spirobacillus cienkowskii]|uniref:pilus assembly FimT family protein n=1 Tax=Spirobacillus cienkowskii TaxID=495820 RepID=UPI0030D00A50